jgi:uncharacterized protein
MNLQEFFAENPRVAIAFSGGADSSYLLYAALHYGARARAYYVNSAFQPAFELEDARRLAGELNADMKVLPVDVLASETVTANPPDRCYHCKQMIFRTILAAAEADGFTVLLDGTNASDDAGDRPGMRALRELSVRSPLRECGLTKAEIRRLSKEAGLFTWDKPAYACLATRIRTGEEITLQKLKQTEKAEGFLFGLGFRDFRVRMVGNTAKLELRETDLPLLLENREKIVTELRKDYDSVLLNLEVRK